MAAALSVVACGCGSEDGGSEDGGPTPRELDAGQDAASSERDADVSPDASDASADAGDAAGDASESDAGCVAFTMPSGVDCSAPSDGVLPRDLRCTGLYGRADLKQVACGLHEYAPAYVLWSDDADKRRFVSLPEGQKVDVSDPDAFVFPNGTKFWKEFSVKGSDGVARLAETRLLQKSPDGWLYTSYVWNAAQTEAIQMDNTLGLPNQDVGGTRHVVPTRDQCNECHAGRADKILGWDALMLGPGATGLTRDKLSELGLIDGTLALSIPGNAVEQAALGYLHANCGISCHNGTPEAKARDSGLFLDLKRDGLASVADTQAFRTGMNKQPSSNAKLDGLPQIQGTWLGIRPGEPDRSLLVARQRLRGFEGQMPRIGTNVVDQAGVQKVVDWIDAMPSISGYPAAQP